MESVKHVNRGDPLSRDHQNLLVDQANSSVLLLEQLYHDLVADPPARLRMFKLTAALTYPTIPVDPTKITVEPTPYSEGAQPLYCYEASATDTYRSYGVDPESPAANGKTYTVWHANVFRDANGWAIGQPTFFANDIVTCWWNRQSTRWEILDPPCAVWHFELAETLTQWSGTTVSAYLRLRDGNGTVTTDCDTTFSVKDEDDIGFWGATGATGTAQIVRAGTSVVGLIQNLRCPSDCVCGEDSGPGPSCGSSSG